MEKLIYSFEEANKLVINHLEKIKGISTKNRLIESLKLYYEKHENSGTLISLFHS